MSMFFLWKLSSGPGMTLGTIFDKFTNIANISTTLPTTLQAPNTTI